MLPLAREANLPARQARQTPTCLGARACGEPKKGGVKALYSLAQARGWTVPEFVDQGQSGVKAKRPAPDAMLAAVRARKVDLAACVAEDPSPLPGARQKLAP